MRPYWSIIGSVAHTLGADWFPTGDRAELKRYEPGRGAAGETVAIRLLANAGAPVLTMGRREIQNWIFLLRCMALLSGSNRDPHSAAFDARPGRVFHRIGYNTSRLCLLLNARDETFQELMLRAARKMGSQAETLNWPKMAPLILATEAEADWAEKARLAIARDYSLAQSTQGIGMEAA
jgi:hypothetical protein